MIEVAVNYLADIASDIGTVLLYIGLIAAAMLMFVHVANSGCSSTLGIVSVGAALAGFLLLV